MLYVFLDRAGGQAPDASYVCPGTWEAFLEEHDEGQAPISQKIGGLGSAIESEWPCLAKTDFLAEKG